MTEEKYIKTFQIAVITASSLLVVALTFAWIASGPGQSWRQVQKQYHHMVENVADSLAEFEEMHQKFGVLQYEIDALNRTDRCVTCHQGIENPYMHDVGQPYSSHPEGYLENHPVEKYGCTICHGGQGRALNTKEAHALEQEVRWDHPLLMEPYIQSSCGQCHLSVFTENESFAGTDVFRKGHEIFIQEGCLGCHKARGVGGIVGPDLTEQGEKTQHEYSFQNIKTEQSIPNWLKEHFRDPEMVSPGSRMLKIDLPEEDLVALTTFVLGLSKPDIAFEYFSMETLNEFKGKRQALEGEKIYDMACSACHGKDGEGKSYEDFKTGVPGILGEDFLRVASSDYIEFTLLSGRSGRDMASWMPSISGLSGAEISEITAHIKDKLARDMYSFDKETFRRSSSTEGRELFAANCSACHGDEALGGTALALNRGDFLKSADDTYIFNTLIRGRKNASMPSWQNLSSENIHALVKYLRSFQSYKAENTSILFSMQDTVQGKLKYRFLCSRCHGLSGEGQTGPAIINSDFLELASDAFLYNTISSGREHTAMFGWSKDVYNAERLDKQDVGNIISYIRMEAEKRPSYIFAGSNPGNKEDGEIAFKSLCAECHGQNGEGLKAPALNNQELINAASNGYLMATISIGRAGSKMPAWGYETEEREAVSGKDRQDIVAFIRSWERIRIAY